VLDRVYFRPDPSKDNGEKFFSAFSGESSRE